MCISIAMARNADDFKRLLPYKNGYISNLSLWTANQSHYDSELNVLLTRNMSPVKVFFTKVVNKSLQMHIWC